MDEFLTRLQQMIELRASEWMLSEGDAKTLLSSDGLYVHVVGMNQICIEGLETSEEMVSPSRFVSVPTEEAVKAIVLGMKNLFSKRIEEEARRAELEEKIFSLFSN